MRSVDVVVPVSSVLDNDRRRALEFVIARVQGLQPASVTVCECSPDGLPHAPVPAGTSRAVIKSPWNKPAAVNEAVYRHTSAEWIFVLDGDVVLDFPKVREQFELLPEGTRFVRPCRSIARLSRTASQQMMEGLVDWPVLPEKCREELLITGGAFLIRRDLFMALRGFDERLDIYMEDTDLKSRLVSLSVVPSVLDLQGYHLYHTPLRRSMSKYAAIAHPRRIMTLGKAIAATVSRIPMQDSLPAPEIARKEPTPVRHKRPTGAKAQQMSIDILVPVDSVPARKRSALMCTLAHLAGFEASRIGVCCASGIQGLPTNIEMQRSDTLAKAVREFLDSSTAEWILIHNPFLLVPIQAARQFAEQGASKFDGIRLVDKILTLNPAAVTRVLSGNRSVRKMDGTMRAASSFSALLVRRSCLRKIGLKSDMSAADIVEVLSAASRSGSRHVTSAKLTAMCLEGSQDVVTAPASPKPVPAVARHGKAARRKAVLAKLHMEGAAPPVSDKPAAAVSGLCPSVAVAVQCHADYLPRLRACLEGIDAQVYAPREKFVVLDRCEAPEWLSKDFPRWTLIKRTDGSPNPGRNAALARATSDWIWYMDADDVPDPDYLMGAVHLTRDHRVGIVHADLKYSNGALKRTPAGLDYWGLRLSNYVSTEALWRVCALKEAGGWQKTTKWDDWICALNVTALGWTTARNPVPIRVTVHPNTDHRNVPGLREFPHKWLRSYCVIALLAGRRDIWPDWSKTVLGMKYPARTSFLFMDNSRNPEFAKLVKKLVQDLTDAGHSATYLRDDIVSEERDRYSRGRVVAHLYNRICTQVQSDVTVFWEDDNLPESPEALKTLVENWDIGRVGGICAVYESRNAPGRVCGTFNKEFWGTMPPLDTMTGKVTGGLGFMPGGFACYHTTFVKRALPFHVDYPEGKADGWDGKLSRSVRAAGMDLVLDGTIGCEHRFRGTK